MKIVGNHQEFAKKRAELDTILLPDADFPSRVLNGDFRFQKGIRFDDLFDDFFSKIQSMSNATAEAGWNLFVLDPNPEGFYEKFGIFRVAEIIPEDTQEDYDDFVWREPGSSAESIAITGSIIVVYPASRKWVLYADRDFDAGLLGFQDEVSMKTFVRAYGEESIFDLEEGGLGSFK